jgi:hypothetical protein
VLVALNVTVVGVGAETDVSVGHATFVPSQVS